MINSNEDAESEIKIDEEPQNLAIRSDETSASEPTIRFCGKNSNMTRSQLSIISLLSIYYLLSSSYYALMAPFLPQAAIHKGVNQSQVGLIFGCYEFVILILSPIFGKYLNVLGIYSWFCFLSKYC
jgi:hypothetical protein